MVSKKEFEYPKIGVDWEEVTRKEYLHDEEKEQIRVPDHIMSSKKPKKVKKPDHLTKSKFLSKLENMEKSPSKKEEDKELEKKQGVPKGVNPKKHERCVKDVKDQGKDKSSAYAICNASLKKSFLEKLSKADRCWEGYEPVPGKKPYSEGSCKKVEKAKDKEEKPFHGYDEDKHSKEGGLKDSYRKKYNRENDANLKRPVTSDNPKGKAKKRKESFCARMKGVKGPTSKDGKLTPKGAALKRWKCSKSLEEKLNKLSEILSKGGEGSGRKGHTTEKESSPKKEKMQQPPEMQSTYIPSGGLEPHYSDTSEISTYKKFIRYLKKEGKDFEGNISYNPKTKKIVAISPEGEKMISEAKDKASKLMADKKKQEPSKNK